MKKWRKRKKLEMISLLCIWLSHSSSPGTVMAADATAVSSVAFGDVVSQLEIRGKRLMHKLNSGYVFGRTHTALKTQREALKEISRISGWVVLQYYYYVLDTDGDC